MKILVTGGAGFIGSHIVEYFQDRAEVCVLDNLRSGFEHNLVGLQCELMVGSILDRDLLRRVMRETARRDSCPAAISMLASRRR